SSRAVIDRWHAVCGRSKLPALNELCPFEQEDAVRGSGGFQPYERHARKSELDRRSIVPDLDNERALRIQESLRLPDDRAYCIEPVFASSERQTRLVTVFR